MSALLVTALLVSTVRLPPAEGDGRGNPVASGAVWQRGLRHFDVNVFQSSWAFALRLLSSAVFWAEDWDNWQVDMADASGYSALIWAIAPAVVPADTSTSAHPLLSLEEKLTL
jgi:hypothetical protein